MLNAWGSFIPIILWSNRVERESETRHNVLIRVFIHTNTTRRMLHRARALALAMALHARLGCESMLAGLGCDILPLIVQEFC